MRFAVFIEGFAFIALNLRVLIWSTLLDPFAFVPNKGEVGNTHALLFTFTVFACSLRHLIVVTLLNRFTPIANLGESCVAHTSLVTVAAVKQILGMPIFAQSLRMGVVITIQ